MKESCFQQKLSKTVNVVSYKLIGGIPIPWPKIPDPSKLIFSTFPDEELRTTSRKNKSDKKFTLKRVEIIIISICGRTFRIPSLVKIFIIK